MNGRRVAAVGVGFSDAARRSGRSERWHAAQAAVRALEDAGLPADQVDGLTTWGGNPIDIAHMVGTGPLRWHLDVGISPAFISPAVHAAHAVASGQADVVMALRVIRQRPAATDPAAGGEGMFADAQFAHPFGDFAPVQWAGLLMNRYLHESDATEEDFARFAVTQRDYATRNPEALQRTPMTVEDYLAAPYISRPVRLLDCDYPCDSGAAVIFTTEERARDLQQKPVFVEATALSAISDMNFELLPDMVRTAPAHCLDELWRRTDLTVADLDCAQLYDGFSLITFQWLEALGICEPGQAGGFVSSGGTRLDGALPTNTDGGATNVGRRHGANFCIEAVRQLRGAYGPDRQVPGAEVALWANAVGPFAGAMVMTAS